MRGVEDGYRSEAELDRSESPGFTGGQLPVDHSAVLVRIADTSFPMQAAPGYVQIDQIIGDALANHRSIGSGRGRQLMRYMQITRIVVTLALSFCIIGSTSQEICAANIAEGRPYTVSPAAEPNYPDTGHRELTDGRKGAASYLDPAWSGYHVYKGQAVDIIVDLGEPATLSSVTIGTLHHPSVGIMQPTYVAAGISNDGQHWAVWDVVYTSLASPGEKDTPERVTYTLPRSPQPVTARYVRLHLPLEISLFLDEIEVEEARPAQASDSLSQAELPAWPRGDQFDLAPIGPYRAPGAATGNVHDIVLLPLYPPVRWDVQQLLPYVTFGRPTGEREPSGQDDPAWEPQDWLFDTVLFTPVATAPSGGFYHTSSSPGSVFADWLWLVDTYFFPDGPLASLDEAVAWAGHRLGDVEHKVKVILALPSPNPKQTEFWSGIDEDSGARQYFESKGLVIGRDSSKNRFTGTLAERRAVVEWMIDEILARWRQAGFHRLELAGFYWYEEGVSEKAEDQALVKQVAQVVHERGSRFYWIPHFRASGYARWREWGFDAAILQPNYYFMSREEVPSPGSAPEGRLSRLWQTAMLARRYEMGIEIELDANVIKDAELRQRLYEYFEAGDRYGYMREAVLAYYQNVNDIAQLARMPGGPGRKVYEDLYRFVQGRLESWRQAGRVVDGMGRPVAEARVQLGEAVTSTDETGYFELPALPVDEGLIAVSTPAGQVALIPLVRAEGPTPVTIVVRRQPEKVLFDPSGEALDGQLPPGLLTLGVQAQIVPERARPGVEVTGKPEHELKLVLGNSPLPFGSLMFNLPEALRDWSDWLALAIDIRLDNTNTPVTSLTIGVMDDDGNAYVRTLPTARTNSGEQTVLLPLVEAATGRFASNLVRDGEGGGINLKSVARVTVNFPATESRQEVVYLGKWYLIGYSGPTAQKGQHE
ncbi:MAG: DUF4855 domain-containing protein [Limnochordales bacterium]|nr:DUF4855 domain-containing protein [Limnochordales bacterium]